MRSTCPDNSVAGGEEAEMSLEEDLGKPDVLQADMKLYQSFVRELETDVWLILREPLVLVPTPEKVQMQEILIIFVLFCTKLMVPEIISFT
jgi:hypothetical protein